MKRIRHAKALLFLLASLSLDAAAVDLSGVRFKAGEPRAGQTLQDSVESEFWLRDFGRTPMILKQHPDLQFEVIGHAGADECHIEKCDALALRRAVLAYRYLLDAGVDPRQLSTLKSVGDREPLPGNDRPHVPELDRRVEINVTFDSVPPSIPAPARILTVAEVDALLGSLHGKVVSIRGHAHVGLEDNMLCSSSEKRGMTDCLWLNFTQDRIETDEEWDRYLANYKKLQNAYDHKWIIVRGTLDARGSGHLGSAFGDLAVLTIELTEPPENESTKQ
jgi:hypothetical protein